MQYELLLTAERCGQKWGFANIDNAFRAQSQVLTLVIRALNALDPLFVFSQRNQRYLQGTAAVRMMVATVSSDCASMASAKVKHNSKAVIRTS